MAGCQGEVKQRKHLLSKALKRAHNVLGNHQLVSQACPKTPSLHHHVRSELVAPAEPGLLHRSGPTTSSATPSKSHRQAKQPKTCISRSDQSWLLLHSVASSTA